MFAITVAVFCCVLCAVALVELLLLVSGEVVLLSSAGFVKGNLLFLLLGHEGGVVSLVDELPTGHVRKLVVVPIDDQLVNREIFESVVMALNDQSIHFARKRAILREQVVVVPVDGG